MADQDDDVAQVLEEEEEEQAGEEIEENEYEGDDEHVETNDEQEETEENNVEGEKCSEDEMYIDDLCESDDEKDEKHALSDELFSKVLSDLIQLKSRDDKRKKSHLIPSVNKFLNTNITKRSITKDVKKNMLNLCQHIHRGKIPVTISVDSKRFLGHLLDKRTPKEDVNVALSENLIVHSILREAIDLIERKNIIEQATAPNEEEDYVRSHDDVMKSVKNKDDLAGMKIVNFLNKRDKLKGAQKATGQLPKAPDAPNPASATPGQRRAQRPGTTVDAAHEKIMEIFKQEGVSRGGSGNVMHKGTRHNIPYTDLVYDLTHNTTEKTANLTSVESQRAMQLLKKIKMPASHIRSTRLRAQYIKMLKKTRIARNTYNKQRRGDFFCINTFWSTPTIENTTTPTTTSHSTDTLYSSST
ncbi:Hypothetical predicted protein [Paramuricea clavata]|uniref:Uncharacterized protein n=1 Tax=Paramuricea clavata TaxID=317549 RepID=A0A6S7GFV7_PARCT|nr:Hypothetical predicted protein [Paramuricea clavata]